MDVEVKIEPYKNSEFLREGLIAEGTYIWDAMRRLGVILDLEDDEDCFIEVKKGIELLSEPTELEREKLGEERFGKGERSAKQTKILRAGELVFLPLVPKVEEANPQETSEKLRDEFAKLPFDQKFATIAQMEAVAFGETLNFVFGLPSNIASRFVDLLATFGRQKDHAERTSKRPAEHRETAEEAAETSAV